jgi:hypothetical protein
VIKHGIHDGEDVPIFRWSNSLQYLFLFPFSSSLWMAAGLLWILDVGNNTAMEPYRALLQMKRRTKTHKDTDNLLVTVVTCCTSKS